MNRFFRAMLLLVTAGLLAHSSPLAAQPKDKGKKPSPPPKSAAPQDQPKVAVIADVQVNITTAVHVGATAIQAQSPPERKAERDRESSPSDLATTLEKVSKASGGAGVVVVANVKVDVATTVNIGLPSAGAAPPSTKSPSTKSPSTKSPSTKSPSTKSPSTKSPSTKSPSTKSPSTKSPSPARSNTSLPATTSSGATAHTEARPTTTPPTTTPPTTTSPNTTSPNTTSPTTPPPNKTSPGSTPSNKDSSSKTAPNKTAPTPPSPAAPATTQPKPSTGKEKRPFASLFGGGATAGTSADDQGEDLFELHVRVRRTSSGIDVLLAGTVPSAQDAASAAQQINQIRDQGMIGLVVLPLVLKVDPDTNRAIRNAWSSVKAESKGARLSLTASIPHKVVSAAAEALDAAIAFAKEFVGWE